MRMHWVDGCDWDGAVERRNGFGETFGKGKGRERMRTEVRTRG
jgi:hypothetical protein